MNDIDFVIRIFLFGVGFFDIVVLFVFIDIHRKYGDPFLINQPVNLGLELLDLSTEENKLPKGSPKKPLRYKDK